MSRLKRNKDCLIKKASYVMDVHNIILKSGDVVGISVRTVNWKPWFQVYLEYGAGEASSFYDGPDKDKAFRMYMDILTAFKGVSEAEKFKKSIPQYDDMIEKSFAHPTREYHNLIMKSPKFLGINDF